MSRYLVFSDNRFLPYFCSGTARGVFISLRQIRDKPESLNRNAQAAKSTAGMCLGVCFHLFIAGTSGPFEHDTYDTYEPISDN